MTNRTFKAGACREQASFLPPRIDDYVGPDNPVLAVEAYVCTLDLEKLGFRHAGSGGGAGQPPYDPADLLKLYLYGYLNGIRSSRHLEREVRRNIELMWLLPGLAPRYRTIATFRKENWDALRAVHREFVLLIRTLGLVSGTVAAIDGSFFHGNASPASIVTRKGLAEQLVALDREIEAYGQAMEANDAAEEAHSAASDDRDGGDMSQQVKALMAQRAKAQADIERLEQSGETQLSRTDADARLLSKRGKRIAGYNVQVAIDEKHKLIVASEVVNDGNDAGQLAEMAKATKEALAVETLTVAADTGYYNGSALKDCEDNGIVAYVPPANRSGRLQAQGRFSHEDFIYQAEDDVYRCPGSALLKPINGFKINSGGRREILYVSLKSVCDACPLRERCLGAKAERRTIYRWEHEDVIERHRERMKDAGGMMLRRSALAEHPFGTLKCRAGYRHFLMRGLDKVRGEWSLMALCYNFTRVLNILGCAAFTEYLLAQMAERLLLFVWRAIGAARTRMAGIWAEIARKSAIIGLRSALAM